MNRLPLPERFHFMNQVWTVRYAKSGELQDCIGQCNPHNNTIMIQRDLAPDVETQTLLHELVHVIEMTLQLDMPERTVDLIAAGVLHLLRSNPHILNSIFEVHYPQDDNKIINK